MYAIFYVVTVQVFISLGHWATSIYIFLSLHLAGVLWLCVRVYTRLPSECAPTLLYSMARMVLIPSTLVTISILCVMYPDFGPCAEVDVTICVVVA